MADSPDHVLKNWVIVIEPGCVPTKKSPFPAGKALDDFLRDVRIYLPFDTVVMIARLTFDHDLWITDEREWWFARGRRPARKPLRRLLTSVLRQGGDRTAAALAGKLVRIWSGEHNAYWRKEGAGYTDGRRFAAWVLPFEKAFTQVEHCGREKKIAFEVVVP